ncbi:FAD-dependent oxidoreductase [Tabrizicola sp.]|uniref:NAD(P)/FAD-dependent oxidoreductase n=1 Tax=Tabrizicola sp. TaxID=2005166 RepID=UPI00286C2C0E|nr:FAD-dependent oxidoreductase [Tabrizicola sp.]
MTDVVIVGAGQAGSALAAKLRALGHSGAITIVGEETAPPYQRPPLSKGYLLGDMAEERLWLRSPDYYTEQAITLRLGAPVSAIDRAAQTVTVAGEALHYDELVLTTGSIPRQLPAAIGGTLTGVHVVRTLMDVNAKKHRFVAGARVVIVGGGYIGLEGAAVAAKLGLDVTVIEAAPRILQRVAAPETSDYFRALHRAHGVKILEGVGLDRILGEGHVSGVRMADGRELPADFVILGIGIRPAIDLAEAAGLTLDNGIATDAYGRTSDPHIWAAGDCASFPWKGGRLRLESVGNAIDQAEAVAANIMGADAPYVAQPWFWSDQYDCKLQIAGLNTGYDTIATRQGEGEAVSFWYYRGETLLAVDAMNDPRAYMVGKRLIEMGKSPSRAEVSNPETNLKALLKV